VDIPRFSEQGLFERHEKVAAPVESLGEVSSDGGGAEAAHGPSTGAEGQEGWGDFECGGDHAILEKSGSKSYAIAKTQMSDGEWDGLKG
jgi:hypothetical protein